MKKILLTFFMLLGENSRAGSIFDVGNGGDIVTCIGDVGLYVANSLDFVANILNDRKIIDLRFKDSVVELDIENLFKGVPSEIELDILEVLEHKSPYLAQDYKIYLNQKLSKNSQNVYSWHFVKLTDVDIKDEGIELPDECEIEQLAVRIAEDTTTTFSVDPGKLATIHMAPLQASFFFVHEWLWGYVDNSEANRAINWYLHSKQAAIDSPEEFRATLIEKGLSF